MGGKESDENLNLDYGISEMSIFRVFLAVSIVSLHCAAGLGQTEAASLMIGNHEVRIGTSADAAIAALRGDFKVISVTNDDSPIRKWVVATAERDEVKDIVGVVFVRDAAVVGLSRDTHVNSSQKVFDNLFEFFSKIKSAEQKSCNPTTWTNYVSGTNLAVVNFRCGSLDTTTSRGIRFVRTTSAEGDTYYTVTEDLGITE